MSPDISRRIKIYAHELGFDNVAIIPALPAKHIEAYLRWLSLGYHGQMAYMARPDRISRRRDLNLILDRVQSIICVSLGYSTISVPHSIARDPSRGRISNYAWGVDYHDYVLPLLDQLANQVQEWMGGLPKHRVYTDTGAILERDHASAGGLGFYGKNTMLIGPRLGSYTFLGEILTTAKLDPDLPVRSMPSCGSCHRCLDACPTAAFPNAYVLDSRRCISYLTIELKGWIPRELRPLMGNWIYGCDICQQVCPFNRFSKPSNVEVFYPAHVDTAAPPLLDILRLDETAFSKRFNESPIKRIKRRGLVRNACVAAGNWGDPMAATVLGDLLNDPEPIIRGHAAWALGRIGDPIVKEILESALTKELNQEAAQEITLALANIDQTSKQA